MDDSFSPGTMDSMRAALLILAVSLVAAPLLVGCGEDPTPPDLELFPDETTPEEDTPPADDLVTLEPDDPEPPDPQPDDEPEPAPERSSTRDPDAVANTTIEVLGAYLDEVARLPLDDVGSVEFAQDLMEHRNRTVLQLQELGRHWREMDDDDRKETSRLVSERIRTLHERNRPFAQMIEKLKEENLELANEVAGDVTRLTSHVFAVDPPDEDGARTVPDPTAKEQTNARAMLDKAKADLERGDTDGGTARLRALIGRYPGTVAAGEAVELLREHGAD